MTNDPIDLAVIAWQAGGDSMFEFCIEAAHIVGRRVDGETLTLAKRIKRSPDTVERYAKAGLLWHAMTQKYPADAELIREALDWQYWTVTAPLWSKGVISLEGVKTWFDEAITNKWEYEKFYSMLPTKKALDSEWQKSALRTAAALDDLCNSPAFGVDDVLYKTTVKVLRIASSLLKGMSMKNIIEILKSEKIADNDFRAAAIANGCELYKLKTDEQKIARARLYRDWRNSGIYPKSDTKSCFEKAIAGEAVPVDAMFEGALLSEITRAADHHNVMAEVEREN